MSWTKAGNIRGPVGATGATGAASTVPGPAGPAGTFSRAAPSAITIGASPFVYRNTLTEDADVYVNGGTITSVQRSADGTTYYGTGVLVGEFHLRPGDYLKITYALAPISMTLFPY